MTQTHADAISATQAPPLKVRRARSDEKERILATIARAFDDDPFVNWAVAQDRRRAARVYDFLTIAYRVNAPYNEIYTADGVPGAAYWAPPGKGKLNVFQQLRLIPMMRSAVTLRRIPSVSKAIGAIEKKHPAEPHWYLSVLGVDPDKQGQGIGLSLIHI
jgi:ribosomal protein S18 acetylase RimI-like enzyme